MNEFELIGIKYLNRESEESNNFGFLPRIPRYVKTFVNKNTGEVFYSNDIKKKKHLRNNHLDGFVQKYYNSYRKKKLTILSMVVDDEYGTITKFMDTFSKRLKQKGVLKLGYVWLRDVGAEKFKRHYHLLFAATFMEKSLYKQLLKDKDVKGYDVEYLKTKNGMRDYLKKKEIYAEKSERSFGKSRHFLTIKDVLSKQKGINTN